MSHTTQINAKRLLERLETLAGRGALPGGGVSRMTLTPEDKSGRDLMRTWFEEAGLTVQVDAAGNMFGLTPGRESEPHVLTGSHLDTVATGGPYDGALGVVGGLEAVQSLRESGRDLPSPLGVAVFTNEEGVRFFPDMLGSLVFTGDLALDKALICLDADGIPLGRALADIGYDGSHTPGHVPVKAFMELHIEQGPILDAKGLSIGVVKGVQGIHWTEYTLSGATNHAGTTPMDMRRDALLGAAEAVVFARRLAGEIGNGQRATIGSLKVAPCLSNVVAEKVTLITDLRNADMGLLQQAQTMMEDEIAAICKRHGLESLAKELVLVDAVDFDPRIVGMVQEQADVLGLSSMPMISGAGHDAQIMAGKFPTGMIFVPSKDGVSHNVREHTEPDDLVAGTRVLAGVLAGLAGQ